MFSALLLLGCIACGTTSFNSPQLSQSFTKAKGSIVITAGGSYSGNWQSEDPDTPAVSITTNEPVTIHDSVISGRGDLIHADKGSQVELLNVTGLGLDPGISGRQRGKFFEAENISSLIAKNTTVSNVSFGYLISHSTISTLKILNSRGVNLEDRASDGNGALVDIRPGMGHFIILDGVFAPNGAEIAWNEVNQSIGTSSTEDVINIYESQGSAVTPIWIHDNYLTGFSSPANKLNYTGNGIITDGPGTGGGVSAFVLITKNQIVHTSGGGIAIAAGHDISVKENSVVSCGIDKDGHWIAMPFANAAYLWDHYRTGATKFFNNKVVGNSGGLVRPDSQQVPMIADFWGNQPEIWNPGNAVTANNFADPCISNGKINLQAEDAERTSWMNKIAELGQRIGDQHLH